MATDTPDAGVVLPELLGVPELACYLHVPPATLYYWRARGEGPPSIKAGKKLLYRARDVERWLEERARS